MRRKGLILAYLICALNCPAAANVQCSTPSIVESAPPHSPRPQIALVPSGGAFASDKSVRRGAMNRAGSLVLGAETIVGPTYFGIGKTLHGSSAVYLFVGLP